MDFLLTLSDIISPYNELWAHRLHWSCFSISFWAMKSVPWDEQGMTMVLGIFSFPKSSSRLTLSPHVFLGHKVMSVFPSLISGGPDPSGREEVMIKQISHTCKPELRSCHEEIPAEPELWSPSHPQGFSLWSALGESDSAVPCHLQETFGRMSRNCSLYASEKVCAG